MPRSEAYTLSGSGQLVKCCACSVVGPLSQCIEGTNEPVAVWYAPDVDIVRAGLYVIVKVFFVVGSFRHFIGLIRCKLMSRTDEFQ